jgi:hypothetical protein
LGQYKLAKYIFIFGYAVKRRRRDGPLDGRRLLPTLTEWEALIHELRETRTEMREIRTEMGEMGEMRKEIQEMKMKIVPEINDLHNQDLNLLLAQVYEMGKSLSSESQQTKNELRTEIQSVKEQSVTQENVLKDALDFEMTCQSDIIRT